MNLEELLSQIKEQEHETMSLDDLINQANKTTVLTKNKSNRNGKVITLPKTPSEMRYYIRQDNKQLISTTLSTTPIKHGYQEKTMVKHYRRAGLTTIQPYELRYLARLSGGDFNEFKKLVRKRVGFAMANSEINELIHRAVKNKPSECMCAVIERADERAKVYVK